VERDRSPQKEIIMSINATSTQFNVSYGSVAFKSKPADLGDVSIENAVKIEGAIQVLDAKPEDFWDITETTAEDGTITQTIRHDAAFIGDGRWGFTGFNVSLTFHPDTYEGGELGAQADLLAAAYEADAAAWRDMTSGRKQDDHLHQLEVVYEQRKTEISTSFSHMVGGYLESCNPTRQEEQKAYDSIQALFTSCEKKYQAVIAKTPKAEWMANDLLTSARNLQRLGAAFPMSGEGVYSLQELEFAAMRVCRGFSVNA